jgi:3-oxoacyl-[acyl-carrier-protein] synthase II
LDTEYAIANGFGFGGVNATVLFRRWTEKLSTSHAEEAGA